MSWEEIVETRTFIVTLQPPLVSYPIRLGFTPFFVSPYNCAAIVAHLMKSTSSRYLIVSENAALQTVADVVCRHFPLLLRSWWRAHDLQAIEALKSTTAVIYDGNWRRRLAINLSRMAFVWTTTVTSIPTESKPSTTAHSRLYLFRTNLLLPCHM
ncbi:uncharacterized protein BT62DRAFT_1080922 [Guyanagaster necrorhizus]|uniref:Uncharacterized protein n=1 Tax=Guyanagaster necrorhizus TaxID=856835 RepID=A0A9P7VGT8_9AGAR|nr:uncharacterized protein BT62DRAFT_1080922 [Guyanagaster necrorhizus MCA 3950]KAG7440303.1 hypothetical protein BT62DRAFT_1080922 [Guyanagaster necrorhizus MCA 3950]